MENVVVSVAPWRMDPRGLQPNGYVNYLSARIIIAG